MAAMATASTMKLMLSPGTVDQMQRFLRMWNEMQQFERDIFERMFSQSLCFFTRERDESTGAVVDNIQCDVMEVLPEREVGIIGGSNHPSRSIIQLLQSFTRPKEITVSKKFPLKGSENNIVENRRRFLHETSILQSLDCEFILQDKIAYACPDYAILITEFCAYGSLDNHIGIVNLDQKLEWFAQLARAIEYVHENGIIHWDIKLSNILIRSDLSLALTGFGMSERLTSNNGLVKAKKVTTGYILPELEVETEEEMFINGFKADSYSLGVTLLSMLMCRMPDKALLLAWSAGQCRHVDPYMTYFLKSLLKVDPFVRCDVTTLIENVLPVMTDHVFNNRGGRRPGPL